jgi:hypothetical protein
MSASSGGLSVCIHTSDSRSPLHFGQILACIGSILFGLCRSWPIDVGLCRSCPGLLDLCFFLVWILIRISEIFVYEYMVHFQFLEELYMDLAEACLVQIFLHGSLLFMNRHEELYKTRSMKFTGTFWFQQWIHVKRVDWNPRRTS